MNRSKTQLVSKLLRQNLREVRKSLSTIGDRQLSSLRHLTAEHRVSVGAGDLLLIDGKWYVTHSGLVRLAARQRCTGIVTNLVKTASEPSLNRWVFKAVVSRSGTKRFVGFGDADPSNVSPLVHGAEMRIAETRAVNRALRKAYGIGICSVEELSAGSAPVGNNGQKKRPPLPTNGNAFGSPARLRDRLCQVIRQHRLDAALVKSYAVDFCRVGALKDAKREQVEAFVEHLSDWAAKDRDALLCQLNRYQAPQQGVA